MTDSQPDRPARVKFENRLQAQALLAGLPAVVAALACIWTWDAFSFNARLTLTLPILAFWLGGAASVKASVSYAIRTLSGLLGALRENDYSLKGAGALRVDVLGEVIREINGLSDALREKRLGERQGQALLGKILSEIDVAVFAFDASGRLQLTNRFGDRLLGHAPAPDPDRDATTSPFLGHPAAEIGLAPLLEGDGDRVVSLVLPGGSGRWKLHRGRYREAGMPYRLVILTDLTRALHAEEREAWKRLTKTLRHEINNSLAPISSIAGSLRALHERNPRPDDWEEDLTQGLTIIESRSEALHRFIQAYSEVTRLPDPTPGLVDVAAWVRRVAGLDGRLPVTIAEGPALTIQADGDQLDQLLINLVRNAIDAASTPKGDGHVAVGWDVDDEWLRLWVDDDGPGVDDPEQAFTPFYTTKPDGAGIGLPLSRQIAENHGGTLALEAPPSGGPGCRAALRLPLVGAA